jgi:predicted secreted Zn-dependent protease
MTAPDVDRLPQSSTASALVRAIVWRLNAALKFNGHPMLTWQERAGLFNLPDASHTLDGIAILPRMAHAEERARRDLLELFDMFSPAIPQPAPASIYQAAVDAARFFQALDDARPLTADDMNRRELRACL